VIVTFYLLRFSEWLNKPIFRKEVFCTYILRQTDFFTWDFCENALNLYIRVIMICKNGGRMSKIFVLIVILLCLLGCASSNRVTDDEVQYKPEREYYPPKVEDTPHFKRLRALLEADGFTYERYEIGQGLVVWGTRGRATKGYGSKDEGIRRLPAGDASKAYLINWAQYFRAFSETHRACFEDETVNEVKKAIDKIVLETDYDYARLYRLPDGIRWEYNPDVLYLGINDDYTNFVIQKVSAVPGVKEVNRISSVFGNHSWNEIVLEDDRVLYLDAAWYDTNGYYIEQGTGNYIVDHVPHYFPTMLTFDKDLFSLGETHYNWGDAVVTRGKSNAAPAAVTAKAAKTAKEAKTKEKKEKEPKPPKDDSDDEGMDVGIKFNFGNLYVNGWAENMVSIGLPVQLGAEFTFSKFAFAILADAGAGIGVSTIEEVSSPVAEWYYGGFGEFYILNKRLGFGFGGGMIDSYVWKIFDTDLPDFLGFISLPDAVSPDPFNTFYLRAGLILRGKKHKLTVYGQYFGDGKKGLGLMWN